MPSTIQDSRERPSPHRADRTAGAKRLRLSRASRLLVIALVLLPITLALPSASGSDDPALTSLAAEIRAQASITFTDLYAVEAPSDLVIQALQQPLLVAALWESYGYTPRYVISALGAPDHRHPDALKAIDPTGISGELHLVRKTANRSVWVGTGEIDHWAAPMLNSGRMVLEIFVAPGVESSRVGVQLYLEPKSRLASFVARSFAATAQEMIERRVRANFSDAAKILEAIHRDPKSVGERLEGELLEQFRRSLDGG